MKKFFDYGLAVILAVWAVVMVTALVTQDWAFMGYLALVALITAVAFTALVWAAFWATCALWKRQINAALVSGYNAGVRRSAQEGGLVCKS